MVFGLESHKLPVDLARSHVFSCRGHLLERSHGVHVLHERTVQSLDSYNSLLPTYDCCLLLVTHTRCFTSQELCSSSETITARPHQNEQSREGCRRELPLLPCVPMTVMLSICDNALNVKMCVVEPKVMWGAADLHSCGQAASGACIVTDFTLVAGVCQGFDGPLLLNLNRPSVRLSLAHSTTSVVCGWPSGERCCGTPGPVGPDALLLGGPAPCW